MGKIKQGILGGVSGSVGGVVGSSWKGINVIKSKPQSVANPKTSGQVAQRGAFSQVVLFATAILASVIKPFWDRFQVAKSGYNAFVSANIGNFNAAGLQTPANLIISKGKMESTPITTVDAANGDTEITVNWVDDSGSGYKLSNDNAVLVAYNATNGEIVGGGVVNNRGDEYTAIEFTNALSSGDVLHVYLCFGRWDHTIVSNTSYKTVTVA